MTILKLSQDDNPLNNSYGIKKSKPLNKLGSSGLYESKFNGADSIGSEPELQNDSDDDTQFHISDIKPLPKTKLHNPLSFSAPIPRPHFLKPTRECTTPISIPQRNNNNNSSDSFAPVNIPSSPPFAPSKSLPNSSVTPTTSSLVKKFIDLMKYINIPDVLHGLENFGYLSSDQSIELFECLMHLRREFPEMARVLQYDSTDRPVCTVEHKGVTCDSCLTPNITGTRYKCAICPNFDLCEKCERKGILTHDISHPRIKMLVPSTCQFEHSCHLTNSQGEKNDCPLMEEAEEEFTTPTYQKRQVQFTTLMKKKQIRETMRQTFAQEQERERQEKERIEQQKIEQEEAELREQEERDRKEGKSILWGYFDNLKKQNKLQPIVEHSTETSDLSQFTTQSSNLTSSINNSSISVSSGSLVASSSSLNSSGKYYMTAPSSLANSRSSNFSPLPSSPLALSSSSPSPSPIPFACSSPLSPSSPVPLACSSPASPPIISSSLMRAPSSSSRLMTQQPKLVVFESPDNSPVMPRRSKSSPMVSTMVGSKLKESATISQSESDDYDSDASSEQDFAPPTPKKSDFFSSLRELLR